MALKWGIFCTGRISQDFSLALNSLPAEHQIKGVASRQLETAQKFATNYRINKFYDSYEELLQDSEIDVIYIGAVGPQHLPLSKLALEHGKHVLCEKPLCSNANEVKELVEFAHKQGLFLMEGIWSRCFPAYQKLMEELRKKSVGDVKQVFVTLSLPLGEKFDRKQLTEIGRSSMNDVGVYCVQLATLVYGLQKPKQILAGGHLNEGGVDESTSTTLIYSNGRTATLLTHYGVNLPCEGIIFGTKGNIKVNFPFWSPTRLETPTETFEFQLPAGDQSNFNFPNSIGLLYEANEVKRCIRNGELESPLLTHNESVLIAEIMDEIKRQVHLFALNLP